MIQMPVMLMIPPVTQNTSANSRFDKQEVELVRLVRHEGANFDQFIRPKRVLLSVQPMLLLDGFLNESFEVDSFAFVCKGSIVFAKTV